MSVIEGCRPFNHLIFYYNGVEGLVVGASSSLALSIILYLSRDRAVSGFLSSIKRVIRLRHRLLGNVFLRESTGLS